MVQMLQQVCCLGGGGAHEVGALILLHIVMGSVSFITGDQTEARVDTKQQQAPRKSSASRRRG